MILWNLVICVMLLFLTLAFARQHPGISQRQHVEEYSKRIYSQRKSGTPNYTQLFNTTFISAVTPCNNNIPYNSRIEASDACLACSECIGFNITYTEVLYGNTFAVKSFYRIWGGHGFHMTDKDVSVFKILDRETELLTRDDVVRIDKAARKGLGIKGGAQYASLELEYNDGQSQRFDRKFTRAPGGGESVHTERGIIGNDRQDVQDFARAHANKHGGVRRMSWFSQRTPCRRCQRKITQLDRSLRHTANEKGTPYGSEVGWRHNNLNSGKPVVGNGPPLLGQKMQQPHRLYYERYGDIQVYPNMPLQKL